MKLQIKGAHKVTGEIVNTLIEAFSDEYHEFIQQYRIIDQKMKL